MNVESQNVEFKSRVDNFKEVGKVVCAFANAYGGRLVIGINDNGVVVGIPRHEADQLQQRLEGAIQLVTPVPFHQLFTEERDGAMTVVAEVYQIAQGAFCTFGGIVYYRAGSVNTKLEGRTLQDYLVNRHILSFDESRSQAHLDDIDLQRLSEFLKKRSPNVPFEESRAAEYLISLGYAHMEGQLWIRNAALLFFAKDPSRFLPQSEVKLARFAGATPVEIIDSRFARSTLLENLREAEGFIRKNTRTGVLIRNLEREEVPEYPLKAVREALVNALTHRDYFSRDAVQINIFDDRLEIINPELFPRA